MRIGVPKEIKNHEYRVGLTPPSVAELVSRGHQVVVETKAGMGIDFEDADYVAAGATILPDAASVFAGADMIVKVKEPLPQEYPLMRQGQLLYTYFHFASSEELTRACLERQVVALAYETVQEGPMVPCPC